MHTNVSATFLAKATRWTQCQCPVDEWISRMGFMHTMEYYSPLNESLTRATTWKYREDIPSGISQTRKDKCCQSPLRWGVYRVVKLIDRKKSSHQDWGTGRVEHRMSVNGHSFLDSMKKLRTWMRASREANRNVLNAIGSPTCKWFKRCIWLCIL